LSASGSSYSTVVNGMRPGMRPSGISPRNMLVFCVAGSSHASCLLVADEGRG
jgi:hypothetical protein